MTHANFFNDYIRDLNAALLSVDQAEIAKAIRLIKATTKPRRGLLGYNVPNKIYVCGNGGSAAIAEHLTCDCLKGIRETSEQSIKPKVISLSSNLPLITAIANDLGYENVYSYQLESIIEPGDVVIAISSSGNSRNIINALEVVRRRGGGIITLTGFDEYNLANTFETISQADARIHVKSHNYGIVEDAHQAVMHMIAQYAGVH
jgi:phosphoheptose isomerase